MDHSGDTPRQPGSPLTGHERALLDRICVGTWPGAREARAQLAHARWGGKSHDDACFLIDVSAARHLPRIPPHDGGPIAALGVVDGDKGLGVLELWVEDGRLASLDYSTFSETSTDVLPELHQIAEESEPTAG
jgi:hypothetical protein